jgi:broad specificity phosphatase PhoE
MMPKDLVLVRHGQSEGNLANMLSREGDDTSFTEAFRERHSYSWWLTPEGRKQARMAGEWIKKNIGLTFDRYYVSEYYRALETATLLELPNAKWYKSFYLRERDYGYLDVMPQKEREERFKENLKLREKSRFLWSPEGGEIMANLCLRLEKVQDTMHRECSSGTAIVVCHGDVMSGFQVLLERMTFLEYDKLQKSNYNHDRIHNGQVIHYTRRNPDNPSEIADYLNWVYSTCPHNPKLSKNSWRKIERKSYSNEELVMELSKL